MLATSQIRRLSQKFSATIFGSGLLALVLLLSSSVPDRYTPTIPYVRKMARRGYKAMRERKIDGIIVHSTQCFSIRRTHNPRRDTFNVDCVMNDFYTLWVGAHYIIDRDGTVFQTIPENYVAYHGGKGQLPDGDKVRINSRTIGIEVLCAKKFKTGQKDIPPTGAQYIALIALTKDLKARHNIRFVLRHSDIAPSRRTDPWNFDWKYFRREIGMPIGRR